MFGYDMAGEMTMTKKVQRQTKFEQSRIILSDKCPICGATMQTRTDGMHEWLACKPCGMRVWLK